MKSIIEMVYEKYTEAETPKSFFYWATLTAISAAVRRNVYLNKKIYVLYPNIYVMLVARSGLRKGAATDLCDKLIRPLDITKVINGRSSIEAIIKSLSEQVSLKSGAILSDAAGIIIASELAASFVGNPFTQLILTDLYDSNYHKDHEIRLKKEGNSLLKNLYVSMCTGTNEENLSQFLDPSSIEGGFIARTIIIKEEEKSRVNPLIDFDKEAVAGIDLTEVIERMKEISKLKGNFTLTDTAKLLFKEWYKALNEKAVTYKDRTGTIERLHDHALKVAMLLSLAERNDLVMEDSHLEEAISSVTGRLKDVKNLTVGSGKSELAKGTKIVLQELLGAKDYVIYRKELLKRNYRDIEAGELDRITDTLEQSGIIEIERTSHGVRFKLKPDSIGDVGNFLRGK